MTALQQPPAGGKSLNALILDDDDFDRRRISRMSAACGLEMNLVDVPTIEGMCEVLDKQVFDVFFLDYRLNSGTGLDALDQIQGRRNQMAAAKIMLTGHQQIDVAVMALKSGCHDYINKDDLTPSVLRQTVEAVIKRLTPKPAAFDIDPQDIDAALLRMAQTQLPQMLAMVLASDVVQDVMRPTLRSVVEDSLAEALQAYDLPTNVLNQPEVKSLIASISSDQQMRF